MAAHVRPQTPPASAGATTLGASASPMSTTSPIIWTILEAQRSRDHFLAPGSNGPSRKSPTVLRHVLSATLATTPDRHGRTASSIGIPPDRPAAQVAGGLSLRSVS